MLIVLLLVFVGTNAAALVIDPTTLIDDCGNGITFSRAQGIACILDAVDANHDGSVTREEIENVKSEYLHWWEMGILKILGIAGVDQIIKDCDFNNDGVITYQDMLKSHETCIPIRDKQDKVTGALCKMKEYICDRAAEKLGHNVYK